MRTVSAVCDLPNWVGACLRVLSVLICPSFVDRSLDIDMCSCNSLLITYLELIDMGIVQRGAFEICSWTRLCWLVSMTKFGLTGALLGFSL